ncbi:MAG: XRE family transcriptional regulator [Oscillospiraceae bacterium]|nr:XRE family transcriptional regulator [Oscillospiraceae bacterium]
MSLGNRLRGARKHAGYTQKYLAQKIGAKHNSVSNWENGLNMPDPVTIESICKVLDITPNYLLMGDELGASDSIGEKLNFLEMELLRKYRSLDKNARGAVNALLGYYYELMAEKHPAPAAEYAEPAAHAFEVVQGRISLQSVAAGTGTHLDEDSFEPITLKKTSLTQKALFYVPVSGNSMEPKYYDGDVLAVEDAPVGYGEIGVFTLDGAGYVKIRGKSELVSLNEDYAPIPMNDDIICNGRVAGIVNPAWILG